jgi:hypothetical protein
MNLILICHFCLKNGTTESLLKRSLQNLHTKLIMNNFFYKQFLLYVIWAFYVGGDDDDDVFLLDFGTL